MPGRATITAAQRRSERASVGSAIADTGIFVILVVATLASSSLTLLTETLRSAGMLAVEFMSVRLLLAVHRERFHALHYGVGKVEMLCNMICCSALVVGGIFIAEKVLHLLSTGGAATAPSGLALGAVAAAGSALVNCLALHAMKSAYRSDSSAIFLSQINGRRGKVYASLSALVAVTASALAEDPAIGALFDGLGAIAGAFFMISIGGRLGWRCVLGLLDLPALPEPRAKAEALLREAGLDPAVALRSRRSGRFSQFEVTLAPSDFPDLATLQARARDLEAALAATFGDSADVCVVLRPGRAAAA